MQLTDIGNKGKAVGRYNERVVFVTVFLAMWSTFKSPKAPQLLSKVVIGVHTYSLTAEANANTSGWCGGCNGGDPDYAKQLEYKEKDAWEFEENWPRSSWRVPPYSQQQTAENSPSLNSATDNKWLTQEQLDSGEEFPSAEVPVSHIPGFWDKVLDIDASPATDPSNAIRNFVRDWAIERDLPFHARSQEGWLRTMMIRVASTGEVLVSTNSNRTPSRTRSSVTDLDAASTDHHVAIRHNEKQNDTIYDQEVITKRAWIHWRSDAYTAVMGIAI